jgi:peptide-methionine (S)-S-oxide reductase
MEEGEPISPNKMTVRLSFLSVLGLFALAMFGCESAAQSDFSTPKRSVMQNDSLSSQLEYAVLAGGCFWCTEAIYVEMTGVVSVESGYTGGSIKNPGYREICTGRTGHAEAVRIAFDPREIAFSELLEVFWRTHDPTTLNRQGADVGTQYRSAIFPQTEEQSVVAKASLDAAQEAKLWDAPIVTSIERKAPFYVAEEYHQDYFANNPDQGYCVAVVGPKVKKFKALFADKLKAQD